MPSSRRTWVLRTETACKLCQGTLPVKHVSECNAHDPKSVGHHDRPIGFLRKDRSVVAEGIILTVYVAATVKVTSRLPDSIDNSSSDALKQAR
jgi:hypothetical protein